MIAPTHSLAKFVYDACQTFLSDHDGVVVVIKVFLDESGTHGQAPVLTVGAVWATADAWKKWTYEWSVAKQPISIFHSSECNGFKGEFEGWEPEARNALVLRLLKVIRDNPIEARVSGFHRQHLLKSMKHRPDVLQWMGDPYYTAFNFVLRSVWNELERQGHEHIAFVHEMNEYKNIALEYFAIERAKRSTPFATMSFGEKPEYAPLQCADIIAYEGFKQLQTDIARKPLVSIFDNTNRLAFVKRDRKETADMGSVSFAFLTRFGRPRGISLRLPSRHDPAEGVLERLAGLVGA